MTELNVIDLDEALLVTAARKRSTAEGLLSATAVGVATAIVAAFFVGKLLLVALALATGSAAFLWAVRTDRHELRITREKFVSCGRVGDNFGSIRTVDATDIRWLEHQEDTSGPETSHHPGGLYAVLELRSVCLLPELDEQQTNLIIERIKDRFPDFRGRWSGHSPFGRHFTSLGLDEPV